jgi:hypothetical protein
MRNALTDQKDDQYALDVRPDLPGFHMTSRGHDPTDSQQFGFWAINKP